MTTAEVEMFRTRYWQYFSDISSIFSKKTPLTEKLHTCIIIIWPWYNDFHKGQVLNFQVIHSFKVIMLCYFSKQIHVETLEILNSHSETQTNSHGT